MEFCCNDFKEFVTDYNKLAEHVDSGEIKIKELNLIKGDSQISIDNYLFDARIKLEYCPSCGTKLSLTENTAVINSGIDIQDSQENSDSKLIKNYLTILSQGIESIEDYLEITGIMSRHMLIESKYYVGYQFMDIRYGTCRIFTTYQIKDDTVAIDNNWHVSMGRYIIADNITKLYEAVSILKEGMSKDRVLNFKK